MHVNVYTVQSRQKHLTQNIDIKQQLVQIHSVGCGDIHIYMHSTYTLTFYFLHFNNDFCFVFIFKNFISKLMSPKHSRAGSRLALPKVLSVN